MITFFLQDYRFGGPHIQLDRYLQVLSSKEKKKIKIIKPKKINTEIGLINLKKINKHLIFLEIIINIIYIIFKKKSFFLKNKISCIVGINNLAPIISSKFLNKKVYWFIVENTNTFTFILFHFIKFFFQPKVIFIDKFLIEKTGFKPHSILPPFLNQKSKIKKIKKISKKKLNLVCVGNINKSKAYDFLIKKLIKNSIQSNLSIIGEKLKTQQNLIQNLENLKSEYELNPINKINFLGFRDQNFINKILKKTDLFILPSYTEGTPNALLEAMSLGCLVLASNVGGISNIIKHNKNGFLFDHKKNNFIKIYNQIIKTDLNKLKKVSKEAQKNIKIKFGNKKRFQKNFKKTFFNNSLK
jgi:glycosyltransferase involved in cell wall biosynthesis